MYFATSTQTSYLVHVNSFSERPLNFLTKNVVYNGWPYRRQKALQTIKMTTTLVGCCLLRMMESSKFY